MKLNLKVLLLSFVASLFSLSAFAVPVTQSTKSCKPLIDKSKKPPKISIQGLNERTHKRLNKALELLAEDQYAEAVERLKSLLDTVRSDYEKATVNLNLAYAYAQQGKQVESLPFFKQALEYGKTTLPHERVQGLRINVASMLYSAGEKKKALNMMLEWADNAVKDDDTAYYMIAAFYSEDGNYDKALCPAYYAVKSAPTPKKDYYQALLAFHWEKKDVKGAGDLLKEMVALFPAEKDYWRQLSQVYFQLDKIEDALAIMEMFYLNGGFNKETDYTWLSALFSYNEVPYRAAKVLEEGLNKKLVKSEKKIWQAIANNYHISNEISKAIVAFGKTGELSDTGESYLKQAELLTDEERWGDAVAAYDKALQKGKLDDPGRAHFRKGVALISMGRCDSGMSVLETASKYKKYRQRASQWTDFAKDRIRNEKC
ncbi:tetratricopeptide repeat protein [Aliikangiella sp. G2MR2-5]|uniref:tetratricopeptide repeat protein n=1 Tax=Aliikangiella sp. G2MR2-5 TaxID=2788943 RepID=UPI0018A8B925|nr:tetratricopeptide repeat protein [Aliikangiella sp. G2MR2-5]